MEEGHGFVERGGHDQAEKGLGDVSVLNCRVHALKDDGGRPHRQGHRSEDQQEREAGTESSFPGGGLLTADFGQMCGQDALGAPDWPGRFHSKSRCHGFAGRTGWADEEPPAASVQEEEHHGGGV